MPVPFGANARFRDLFFCEARQEVVDGGVDGIGRSVGHDGQPSRRMPYGTAHGCAWRGRSCNAAENGSLYSRSGFGAASCCREVWDKRTGRPTRPAPAKQRAPAMKAMMNIIFFIYNYFRHEQSTNDASGPQSRLKQTAAMQSLPIFIDKVRKNIHCFNAFNHFFRTQDKQYTPR